MGGPNSFFNDPFNQRQYESGGMNEQIAKSGTAKRKEVRSILESSFAEGGLSQQTYNEVKAALDIQTTTMGAMDQLAADIQAEKAGTSEKGKSRLATEKLFELSVDQPGRRQTILTPRSNASKVMMGV